MKGGRAQFDFFVFCLFVSLRVQHPLNPHLKHLMLNLHVSASLRPVVSEQSEHLSQRNVYIISKKQEYVHHQPTSAFFMSY